jgi:hypothetical protein
MIMANVRFIVKCVAFHRDGNTDPVEVKIGEVLNLNENQWLRLKQSAPFSFELIERRAPIVDPVDIPAPTQAEPEAVDPPSRREPTIRAAVLADRIAGKDAEA